MPGSPSRFLFTTMRLRVRHLTPDDYAARYAAYSDAEASRDGGDGGDGKPISPEDTVSQGVLTKGGFTFACTRPGGDGHVTQVRHGLPPSA